MVFVKIVTCVILGYVGSIHGSSVPQSPMLEVEVVDKIAQNFEYALEKSVANANFDVLHDLDEFTNRVLLDVQHTIDNEPKSRRVVLNGVNEQQQSLVFGIFKDHFQRTMNVLHTRIDSKISECQNETSRREEALNAIIVNNAERYKEEKRVLTERVQLLQGQMEFILNPKYWSEWFADEVAALNSAEDHGAIGPAQTSKNAGHEDTQQSGVVLVDIDDVRVIPDRTAASVLELKPGPFHAQPNPNDVVDLASGYRQAEAPDSSFSGDVRSREEELYYEDAAVDRGLQAELSRMLERLPPPPPNEDDELSRRIQELLEQLTRRDATGEVARRLREQLEVLSRRASLRGTTLADLEANSSSQSVNEEFSSEEFVENSTLPAVQLARKRRTNSNGSIK